MMDCQTWRDLLELYLDGALSSDQLAELRAHADGCASCRREYDRANLMQSVVEDALLPRTPPEKAAAALLEKLPSTPQPPVSMAWRSWTRRAVAAGLLVAVGLGFGLALGNKDFLQPTTGTRRTEVPFAVTRLTGTVLVKHAGATTWSEVEPGSPVYLGDTFHSTPKSGLTLTLDTDSTIVLEQNSMLALTLYNGETQFYIEHGRCTATLENEHPPFFITTPHGRVEALGTEFTVTVE